MDEPHYVAPGSEFDDEEADLSTSGIERIDLIQMAQKICRRPKHPFRKPAEKNKWLKFDRQVVKGTIGQPWIDHCMEWAKSKNQDRLIILLPALTSYLLNKAAMTDWLGSQAEEMGLAVKDTRDLAEDGF